MTALSVMYHVVVRGFTQTHWFAPPVRLQICLPSYLLTKSEARHLLCTAAPHYQHLCKSAALVGGCRTGSQWVVQKYIEQPLLISGRKFDIRSYCLLTPDHKVHIYKHSYIRTSSTAYDLTNLQDRYSPYRSSGYAVPCGLGCYPDTSHFVLHATASPNVLSRHDLLHSVTCILVT